MLLKKNQSTFVVHECGYYKSLLLEGDKGEEHINQHNSTQEHQHWRENN